LEFHAYNVDAVLNKAAGGALVPLPVAKLDWSAFTSTGLDINGALTTLNATSLGDLTTGVDLAVDGGVALTVLGGAVVAKGDFTIALVRSGAPICQRQRPRRRCDDADAEQRRRVRGVGGGLTDVGSDGDYSNDTVANGTLGFGATVGTLTLVRSRTAAPARP